MRKSEVAVMAVGLLAAARGNAWSGYIWYCDPGQTALRLSAELIVPFNPSHAPVGLAFWPGMSRLPGTSNDGVAQPAALSDEGWVLDESYGPPTGFVRMNSTTPMQRGDHVYFDLEGRAGLEVFSRVQVNNDPDRVLNDVWKYNFVHDWPWSSISEERQANDTTPMISHLWRNVTLVHNCGPSICNDTSSDFADIFAFDNPTATSDPNSNLTTCHYDHVYFQPLNEANASATRLPWSAVASAASVHLAAAAARPTWTGDFEPVATTNVVSLMDSTTSSWTTTHYTLAGSEAKPAPGVFGHSNDGSSVVTAVAGSTTPTPTPSTSFSTVITATSSSSATATASGTNGQGECVPL